jgi:hypothetical protein
MDSLKINEVYQNIHNEHVFILYEKDEEFAGVNLANDDLKWYSTDGQCFKGPALKFKVDSAVEIMKRRYG